MIRRRHGQGIVEYGIVLVMVSIIALAAHTTVSREEVRKEAAIEQLKRIAKAEESQARSLHEISEWLHTPEEPEEKLEKIVGHLYREGDTVTLKRRGSWLTENED